MKASIKAIGILAAGIVFGYSNLQAQTLKEAIRMTESERYEAASSAFKKLVKSGDEQGGDTWFYYGDNFLQWEVLDSAKMMFQKGLDSKPSNPLNFVGLGSINWREADWDAAKQNFYKATSLTTTQAKELPKDKAVLVYLKIADAYLQAPAKNLPDALVNINAAMKLDPKNPEVYLRMGDYCALKNASDVSDAIKNYEKAGELDKTSTKALLRQGQIMVRVQNWDEGLKFYNQAVKLDSNFAPVFRARGELLFKAGRYNAAINDYRKYLKMNDSRNARENYAKLLFLIKDYKIAVNEIIGVQKKDSSAIILYRVLGYSYYEINDYDNGVKNMEKFFAKQKVQNKPPLVASDFAYYGKLLGKTGKDSLGIEQIKIALKMDSSKTEWYGDIATIYFRAKRYPDAIKYYQLKIQKSTKVNLGDYGPLGQSFYRNKQYGLADSAFMKMTDLYPVYSVAWRARCAAAQENPEKPEKAKDLFELVIKNAGTDIERNKKDLIDAYSYLSAYYYLTAKNFDCTKAKLLKLQELDPTNEKVKLLEDKQIKAANADNCKQ